MLISPAYAQAAAGSPPTGALIGQFAMFGLVFVIFWLLLFRPQQKRLKAHRELIASVKRGDEVVTGGGFIGKVTKVTDTEVEVEIAKGVIIRALKGTLSDVRGRVSPVPANDTKA